MRGDAAVFTMLACAVWGMSAAVSWAGPWIAADWRGEEPSFPPGGRVTDGNTGVLN